MKRKWIKTLPIFIFIFLTIYRPLFLIKFNIMHILAIIAYYNIIINYNNIFSSIIRIPILKIFIVFQFLSIIYILILNLVTSGDVLLAYNHFMVLFEVIPISIYISLTLIKYGFDKYKFYNLILLIGIVQVVFVLVTIASPTARDFLLVRYARDDFISLFSLIGNTRVYGFARSYTFTMPLFQGLCVIIASMLSIHRSRLYLLLIPLYIISITVNARIGLISLPVAASMLLFYYQKGKYLKQLIVFPIIIIISFGFIEIVNTHSDNINSSDTWVWLKTGMIDIENARAGELTGSLYILKERMLFVPPKNKYIFGTGILPYGEKTNLNSDIGYVQIFYFGGIVYLFLAYMVYIITIRKLLKISSNLIEKSIYLSILVYMLLVNIKGNAINDNELTIGIILIFVFSVTWDKMKLLQFNRTSKDVIDIKI